MMLRSGSVFAQKEQEMTKKKSLREPPHDTEADIF